MVAALVASGLAAGLANGQQPEAPAAQERADADELETKLERYLELAIGGAPAVRPQAADRLAAMGAPAAERILAACGDTPAAMASLGADLVEVLGRFGDDRLRRKLWDALADRDFPWRPAAARSLAEAPLAVESERFAELLTDRLAAVRVAALHALDPEAPGTQVALWPLLTDEDDRVRRAAAGRLYDLGEAWALLWPLEELRRTDRFFDLDTGRIARFEAARLLREKLGDLGGYRPARDPAEPESARAIEALEARVRALIDDDAPRLPRVARAAEPVPPGTLGVELRSCRAGELFLQWGPGDVLRVGLGNPRAIELAPGTLAKLEAAAAEATAAVGEARLFGTPGCDLECLRVRGAGGTLEAFWLRKGPEPDPDLRPGALDELVRALVDSVPSAEAELAARLSAGLEAVGGPVPAAATGR